MHDPMFLVFDVDFPARIKRKLPGWLTRLGGLDVWHDEPDGRDSGTVCKGYRGNSALSWHSVRWAWAHRSHLHYRFWPYLMLKRWIVDRCDECGRRFLWRDARIGNGMNSPGVLHMQCSSLVHVRRQLDDLTRYVQATADETTRWRAEYRLNHIDKADRA